MNTLKQKSIILILVESSILSMTCVIYSNKYQKHTIVRFPVSNGKPYSFRTVSYHWFCFVSFFPFYCYFSLLFFLFFFFCFTFFCAEDFSEMGCLIFVKFLAWIYMYYHLKFQHLFRFVKITFGSGSGASCCNIILTSSPRISPKTSKDKKLKFSRMLEDMLV